MKNIDSKNWIPDPIRQAQGVSEIESQVGNDNFKGKRIHVAIGMSGGVDSSVAAKMLKDQGYEVVGFMMKLWPGSEMKCAKDNACCDIDGLQDAKRIAAILDIPFYVVDVREKFKEEVADYFIEEYKNLRTPNPCVKCNEKIKFGWLLDFAKKTGCDFLATGHYARIAISNSEITNSKLQISNKLSSSNVQNSKLINELTNQPVNFHLLRSKDETKDQSYFLYRLNQEQLSKIIFPVGQYTKKEVRAMAKKWNLPVHEKKESQEICFIQEKDYREFLKKNIPAGYFKSGDIVDLSGNVIGKHDGLINYTIGQRRGVDQSGVGSRESGEINPKLQTPNSKPMYVVGFDVKKNQLIAGEDKDIYKDKMNLENIHFIQNNELRIKNNAKLQVKIRYRHPVVLCKAIIHPSGLGPAETDNSKYIIQFNQPQRAITPGQSAVFYDGEEVLGGGIIEA